MNRESYKQQQRQAIRAVANRETTASVVPFCSDFRADPRRCLTIIQFLPPALATRIHQEIILPLSRFESWHHFYDLEEMHITLQPIRKIADPPAFNDSDIEGVKRHLGPHFAQFPAIQFDLEGVVVFPTSCAISALCGPELQALLETGNALLQKIGIPNDKSYADQAAVFGNITFCRFSKPPGPAFQSFCSELAQRQLGQFCVNQVSLVDCNAVCAQESRRIHAQFRLAEN
ncbi:MAG: hypothetical protein KDC71_23150 [Acidobacteria bacterium]|nr:hypothetical protein [Acidobacteriota bacterium]